ncbi:MAG: UDP-N-acetylmuramate dehydrogenase, partial [Bacteroidia bacterium]|nr:UDP-N-acetylmuramate dehydrogenase [Bacteroidia bacterium]
MPQLQEQVSLRPYHTFGLDVQARWLFAVHSEEEALEFLADNRWSQHPLLILGGGSNILFRGDVEGIVLLNRIKGIEVIEETDTDVRVRVGAGEPWHPFVLHCLDQGWYGIENLSLIPGTVGAAPIQNIGAYGVEIKEFFDHLEAMHLSTLQVRKFGKTDCAFGYRDSFFKQEGKGKYLITRVCFRLSKVPKPNLSYAALTEEIGTDPTHITPRMVSDAVIRVRQSKLPD